MEWPVDLATNTRVTSATIAYSLLRANLEIKDTRFLATLLFLSVQKQEEGRTALSLALMEQREDIADLIISIDDTDINAPDTIVSAVLRGIHASVECFLFARFLCLVTAWNND